MSFQLLMTTPLAAAWALPTCWKNLQSGRFFFRTTSIAEIFFSRPGKLLRRFSVYYRQHNSKYALIMRMPFTYHFGGNTLPADLLAKLKKLEWDLTNPYSNTTATPLVPATYLAPLIAEIPAQYCHTLMMRPLNFFDDGMTTFDIHAEKEYKWRADAIQAVMQGYWDAIQVAWKMYPVTAERRTDLIKQMRKHWYQDNFFAKLPN